MKILQPMKPAKLDLTKPSHQKRLDEWFENPACIAEPKIDGCHYTNDAGRFLSTKNVDKTGNFPHLVEAFAQADLGQTILDGEIYYPDEAKSFAATQITGCLGQEAVRRQESNYGWIYYCVFDVLRDPKGNWLINQPWSTRREILEFIGARLKPFSKYYQIIPVVRRKKKQYFEQILREGGEGIVLKHTQSLYVPGKRPISNWIKLKAGDNDDVVILGFDPPTKKYTGTDYENWPYWENGEPVSKNYYLGWIGSISFGKYDLSGELVYLGSCTGISDELRKEFTENQDKYVGQVMEIKYMEKTPDGKYRHPNFVRIHPDKNAYECVIEQRQAGEV